MAETLNISWIVLAGTLVFLMQAGFLCLEAGVTRSKNSINVAVKNIADFGLSVVLFWAVGFGVMFGTSAGGWLGADRFTADLANGPAWDTAFFFYQLMFCGTAVTIVSGAVAERVKFSGYLIIAAVVALAYPVFGHWAWGGALSGSTTWLSDLGFVDFAGSTVVHGVGGWFALVACLIIGPRLNRFDKDGKHQDSPGSNLQMAMFGTLLLWFGWIGFNGGSTLALDQSVPGILVNTMLGGAAGLLVAGILGWAHHGYLHPGPLINGSLAGLVAVTANCHAVSTPEAVVIGAIGALICQAVARILLHYQIDDVISAVPVHLAAGVWGTLAIAIFGDPEVLGTGLSRWEQLGVQAIGIGACGAMCVGVGWPALWLANRLVGLRVSEEDEKVGLNVAEHRASTELFDFASTLEKQAQSKDLSLRAPVEPFTEIGQIAERYNELIDILEKSTTDVNELKATEKLLRQARDQAEQANDSKTEFLANMSHEIRTPLHGILSFSRFGLKKSREQQQEKLTGYFDRINTSGNRLLLLVNDLLDLAKLECGRMDFEFAPHDIGVVIDCVVDEYASLLSEKDIRVEFDRGQTPIRAEADRDKIMQVIRNLLSNAAKFAPADSVIEVCCDSAEGGRVRVSVQDRGPGIPEDEMTHIFDKFAQSSKTKSEAGGTGLGLSICHEIMKNHGGRIWAENRSTGGARFILEWPSQRDDQVTEAWGEAA
ncbi:MAG: ammonium transporter [Planctomycetota bacterium]